MWPDATRLRATCSAKVVLPRPGRAPTSTSSPERNPPSRTLSKAPKPDGQTFAPASPSMFSRALVSSRTVFSVLSRSVLILALQHATGLHVGFRTRSDRSDADASDDAGGSVAVLVCLVGT